MLRENLIRPVAIDFLTSSGARKNGQNASVGGWKCAVLFRNSTKGEILCMMGGRVRGDVLLWRVGRMMEEGGLRPSALPFAASLLR